MNRRHNPASRGDKVRTFSERDLKLLKPFMKRFSRFHVWIYKKSKGRRMKYFRRKYPVCIIGTRGAKSGAYRETPVLYLPYEKGILLVGSQLGMPKHPAWYHNIMADPLITVTHAGTARTMTARRLSEDEKRRIWPYVTSLYPDYDKYQAATKRSIPVFECRE